jgi:hypothetical protein
MPHRVYYRKFIKDYGKIAHPLTQLTKKDNFGWGKQEQEAFDTLKGKLVSAPVLALLKSLLSNVMLRGVALEPY